MLELTYPRDLAMVGAIFGVAGFAWAGWAQERPPGDWGWAVALGVLALFGIALAGISIPLAARHWNTPTAITRKSAALRVYLIVFWVEIVVAAGLAVLASRSDRDDLVAPLILAVVGIHFFALAPVFAQPVLYLAAAPLTVIALLAALLPSDSIARSFWCGILGAPVFLAVGAWCTAAARARFHRPERAG